MVEKKKEGLYCIPGKFFIDPALRPITLSRVGPCLWELLKLSVWQAEQPLENKAFSSSAIASTDVIKKGNNNSNPIFTCRVELTGFENNDHPLK